MCASARQGLLPLRMEAAARPMDLTAQDVEELRGGRDVDHLHVVLGAELEEPLEPGARMLRALSLVAVRQQEHETAHALPLRLRARHELIYDDLRLVGKIAELRLPDHQPARIRA